MRISDWSSDVCSSDLEGWTGEGDWTQGKKFDNVRAIFPMYDTPFHMITLAKSGIESFEDLDGKRVGVGPRAGTPGTYFPRFFKDFGMDVTVRHGAGRDMSSSEERRVGKGGVNTV